MCWKQAILGPAVSRKERLSLVQFSQVEMGHLTQQVSESIGERVQRGFWAPYEATSQVGLGGEGLQDTPRGILWVWYVHFLQGMLFPAIQKHV